MYAPSVVQPLLNDVLYNPGDIQEWGKCLHFHVVGSWNIV